jgi:LemA protein
MPHTTPPRSIGRRAILRITLALATLAALAVAAPGCAQYNVLVDKEQVVDQRFADLQAALQRRSDLIPNIVATVRASAQHEERTLTDVTEARARATGITLSAEDLEDPQRVAQYQQAQDQLRGALSRLLVQNEAYPQLQANAQFHDLVVELEGTENRILRARELYNDAVRDFNSELARIGGTAVNRATGRRFRPRVYLTATPEAQVAPRVQF